MKTKELIDYLKQFPEDAELSMIIVNLSTREIHPVLGYTGIIDTPVPTLCIETGEPESLDEIGGTV